MANQTCPFCKETYTEFQEGSVIEINYRQGLPFVGDLICCHKQGCLEQYWIEEETA